MRWQIGQRVQEASRSGHRISLEDQGTSKYRKLTDGLLYHGRPSHSLTPSPSMPFEDLLSPSNGVSSVAVTLVSLVSMSPLAARTVCSPMLLLIPASSRCAGSKYSSAGWASAASMLPDACPRVGRKLGMKPATSYREWQTPSQVACISRTHWGTMTKI